MISRYEQGLLEAPLTLERLVGWALCCASLSAPTFRELLELAGYYPPPGRRTTCPASTASCCHYRALPLPDQIVLRRSLLWHVLGLHESDAGRAGRSRIPNRPPVRGR